MTVRSAESERVVSNGARDRDQAGADVRVKHSKFKLQIVQAVVRLPSSAYGVELGYVGGIDLYIEYQ